MIKSEELTNPKSCINQSQDDEMVFVLCARDPSAPAAVREWARQYQARGGRPEKVAEALQAAKRMEEWREARAQRIKAAVGALSPESIAAVNSGGAYARALASQDGALEPTVTASDSDISWQMPQTD